MEYTVIQYDSARVADPILALQQGVNEYLGLGWKLQGGISVSGYVYKDKVHHTWAQALINTSEEERIRSRAALDVLSNLTKD
jgi:hypothetical protein